MSWTARLRTLLPDSSGALAAAQREELWARVTRQQYNATTVEFHDFRDYLENLVVNAGLAPPVPALEPQRLQFLAAGLHAAVAMVGGMISRQRLRVILMRLHQYLDVYALLNTQIPAGPRSTISREAFGLLLSARQHTLSLQPGGPLVPPKPPLSSVDCIFKAICGPGRMEDGAIFDSIACWSVKLQHVRSGSGALATQPRLLAHQVEPSSVAILGGVHSARGRSLLGVEGSKWVRGSLSSRRAKDSGLQSPMQSPNGVTQPDSPPSQIMATPIQSPADGVTPRATRRGPPVRTRCSHAWVPPGSFSC